MVGIQIGSEQEEKKREEERGFENIVDFNVTSNAEEKFAGATLSSAEDFDGDALARRREREQGDYMMRGSMTSACFPHPVRFTNVSREVSRMTQGGAMPAIM